MRSPALRQDSILGQERSKAGGWRRGRAAVSGDQESFGIFLGDGEEFEGGLARAARALFPAADSVGAYVQVAGEERLARVKRLADLAHFFGGNRLGP